MRILALNGSPAGKDGIMLYTMSKTAKSVR